MRKSVLLVTLIPLMLSAVPTWATVIHVPGEQPSIQGGIDVTVDGDTVLVASGTYSENINFRGKNIVVASHYVLSEDPGFIEATIIDGSNPTYPDSASCVVFCSGEDSTAVLQGFTLTGGEGTRWFDDLHSQSYWRAGGGILTYKSSPTIIDNRIVNNAVTNSTGVDGAQGGGLLCYSGNPLIQDNIILSNQANYGAGIVTDYTGARIRRNVICRNTAGQSYGGGAYWTIGNGSAPIIIENNTIVENSSGTNGGAMTLYSGTVTARNNIIWGNTQSQGGPIAGSPTITYSDVEGGFPGHGNIDADPQFEDGTYNLSENSPCIDSGDPNSPLDSDGTRADMGALMYPRLDAPLIRISGSAVDDSQGNNNGRADGGETVDLIVTLSNTRLDATGTTATLTNDDPDVEITEASADFGIVPKDESTTNEDNPFFFSVNAGAVAHPSTFHVNITADGGYAHADSFDLIVGTSTILLVDDDGGDSCEGFYVEGLETKQIFPEEWDISSKGCPTSEKLQQHEAVFWLTGNERSNTLTEEEQTAIVAFLDGEGKLLITGQNIGYDLVEDGSAGDAEFYANYLHAEYISDSIEETFLYGIEGDPISGAFNLLTIDEGQTSPSVIAPRDGASAVLIYQVSREVAAIKCEGNHKVVYFALGMEGIGVMGEDDDEVRGTLMEKAMQWFTYVPIEGDVNQDGVVNILDVLMAVNIVLGLVDPTPTQEWAADCNANGIINIVDVIGIVNVVLDIGTCPPTALR